MAINQESSRQNLVDPVAVINSWPTQNVTVEKDGEVLYDGQAEDIAKELDGDLQEVREDQISYGSSDRIYIESATYLEGNETGEMDINAALETQKLLGPERNDRIHRT